MSELTKEKIYKKELIAGGATGNNNLERIRSLAGGVAFEDIKDKNGNLRFVEGDGTQTSQSGVNISYCKWSLSGTHLMVVVAGTITSGTTIESGKFFGIFTMPSYILNKINTVWGSNIERKEFSYINSNNGIAETTDTVIFYKTDNELRIRKPLNADNVTLSNNSAFRIQFDLLIDSE